MGNDINDLEALLEVGVPIIVEDAYFPLKKYNFIITNLKGGHVAVREVCENIIRSKMLGEE